MLQDDQAKEKTQLEEDQRKEVADLAVAQQIEKDAEIARLAGIEETARLEKQEAEAVAVEKAGEEAVADQSQKAV